MKYMQLLLQYSLQCKTTTHWLHRTHIYLSVWWR